MEDIDFSAITTDRIEPGLFTVKDVELSVLRLDKVHPIISGNKWFKLRFYLDEARANNKKAVVTFGGAFSNHIVATAAACANLGLSGTGLIRGEEPATLSPTLVEAKRLGMQLFFLNRADYAKKKIPAGLKGTDYLLIPEGGYGETGARGASTISDYFSGATYTHICCAVGTGTMMAGLINASTPQQTVIGISVLKNNFQLEEAVRALLENKQRTFQIFHDHSFGGYARQDPTLIHFMNSLYETTGIPTDFVYTGKLFYGIIDLVEKKLFPAGSKVLVIHSGGLQGNASLGDRTLIF